MRYNSVGSKNPRNKVRGFFTKKGLSVYVVISTKERVSFFCILCSAAGEADFIWDGVRYCEPKTPSDILQP